MRFYEYLCTECLVHTNGVTGDVLNGPMISFGLKPKTRCSGAEEHRRTWSQSHNPCGLTDQPWYTEILRSYEYNELHRSFSNRLNHMWNLNSTHLRLILVTLAPQTFFQGRKLNCLALALLICRVYRR